LPVSFSNRYNGEKPGLAEPAAVIAVNRAEIERILSEIDRTLAAKNQTMDLVLIGYSAILLAGGQNAARTTSTHSKLRIRAFCFSTEFMFYPNIDFISTPNTKQDFIN